MSTVPGQMIPVRTMPVKPTLEDWIQQVELLLQSKHTGVRVADLDFDGLNGAFEELQSPIQFVLAGKFKMRQVTSPQASEYSAWLENVHSLLRHQRPGFSTKDLDPNSTWQAHEAGLTPSAFVKVSAEYLAWQATMQGKLSELRPDSGPEALDPDETWRAYSEGIAPAAFANQTASYAAWLDSVYGLLRHLRPDIRHGDLDQGATWQAFTAGISPSSFAGQSVIQLQARAAPQPVVRAMPGSYATNPQPSALSPSTGPITFMWVLTAMALIVSGLGLESQTAIGLVLCLDGPALILAIVLAGRPHPTDKGNGWVKLGMEICAFMIALSIGTHR